MSPKRAREANDAAGERTNRDKRQRKGFVVGPEHLPEGQYKRKTQQIKRSLIDKAKLKKEYAKVQSQQAQQDRPSTYNPYDRSPSPSAHQPTTEPHPARQSLIEEAGVLAEQAEEPADHDAQADTQRRRRPKQVPFAREQWRAQKDKEEMEGRRQAREDAARQRQFKMEERERFRKAMAKARTGGKNGQRKLGRESKVLLDKVKRIVAEG